MTLIVARKLSDSIHVVADTKIYWDDAIHLKQLEHGALKCIAISKTCCIAYADSTAVAERAIRPLIDSPTMSRIDICNHLLENHKWNNWSAEFILVTATDLLTIDRISNGSIESDLPNAWIGDAEAFEHYQTKFLSKDECGRIAKTDREKECRMDDALRAVIESGFFPNVAGFLVHTVARRFASHRPGVRYWSYSASVGHQAIENSVQPTSVLASVGVANGSYRYNVHVPDTDGVGAIAVYIVEARCGVLYYPKLDWKPIKILDVECRQFLDIVESNYGLSLLRMGIM